MSIKTTKQILSLALAILLLFAALAGCQSAAAATDSSSLPEVASVAASRPAVSAAVSSPPKLLRPVAKSPALSKGLVYSRTIRTTTELWGGAKEFDVSSFKHQAGFSYLGMDKSFLYSDNEVYFIGVRYDEDSIFCLYHLGADGVELVLENIDYIAGTDGEENIYLVRKNDGEDPVNTLLAYNPVTTELSTVKENIGTAAVSHDNPSWIYYTVGGGSVFLYGDGESEIIFLQIWRLDTSTGEETQIYQDDGYTTIDYVNYYDGKEITEYAIDACFYTDVQENNKTLYVNTRYSLPGSCFPVYEYRGLKLLPDGGIQEIHQVQEHAFDSSQAEENGLSTINGGLGALYATEEYDDEGKQVIDEASPAASLAQTIKKDFNVLPHNEYFTVAETHYLMLWPHYSPVLLRIDSELGADSLAYTPVFYAEYQGEYYMSQIYGCRVGSYLFMYGAMSTTIPVVFIVDANTEKTYYAGVEDIDIWTKQ